MSSSLPLGIHVVDLPTNMRGVLTPLDPEVVSNVIQEIPTISALYGVLGSSTKVPGTIIGFFLCKKGAQRLPGHVKDVTLAQVTP